MSGGLFGGLEDAAGQARDAAYRVAGGEPGVKGEGQGSFESVRDALYQAAGGQLDEKAVDDLTTKAKAVMADVLGCDVDALRPDADLAGDLGADEETIACLAAQLESELGVDDLFEEVEYWQLVEDVLYGVGESAAAQSSAA